MREVSLVLLKEVSIHMSETAQRRDRTGRQKGHRNILELNDIDTSSLTRVAKVLNVPGRTGMRKRALRFQVLKAQTEQRVPIFFDGVLECLPGGFGFLRALEHNDSRCRIDIYVSPSQIRRFDLRTGDTVSGQIRPPKDGQRYYELTKIEAVIFAQP